MEFFFLQKTKSSGLVLDIFLKSLNYGYRNDLLSVTQNRVQSLAYQSKTNPKACFIIACRNIQTCISSLSNRLKKDTIIDEKKASSQVDFSEET